MINFVFSGAFGDIVIAVCMNTGNKYTDPLLRSAAVLALSKFMCVSKDFWCASCFPSPSLLAS